MPKFVGSSVPVEMRVVAELESIFSPEFLVEISFLGVVWGNVWGTLKLF